MNVKVLAHLALKHARNALQESLYIGSGVDLTRPVKVYGIVNERCNYKCRYCEYWRQEHYQDELSIDQWKAALRSLKDFIGRYHIEFSGGEPFMKKGFLDLLEWCRAQDIQFGVTTNGSALKSGTMARFVRTHPFNVNISVDSREAAVHDYTRGITGSLDHLSRAIPQLREEQERQGVRFPVIVKSTVTSANFRELPEFGRWAIDTLMATMVNYQPVDRWTQETRDELWIKEADLPALEDVVERLIELKMSGLPIMTSESTLKLWVNHFKEETAPASAMPCRVGLRNYFIRSNGDVEVCWYWPPIGNVKAQSASEIWASAEARKRRDETTACERLCLFSCLSANSLLDKVQTGWKLLRSDDRGATTSAFASDHRADK